MEPQILDIPDETTPKPPQASPPPPPRATPPRPPRASASPPPRAPRASDQRNNEVKEKLDGYYTMASLGLVAAGMKRQDQGIAGVGVVLGAKSETIATAWLDVAEKNATVRTALYKLVEVSAVGELIGLHVMALVPFLASRGIIPEQVAAAMAEQMTQENENGSGNAT